MSPSPLQALNLIPNNPFIVINPSISPTAVLRDVLPRGSGRQPDGGGARRPAARCRPTPAPPSPPAAGHGGGGQPCGRVGVAPAVHGGGGGRRGSTAADPPGAAATAAHPGEPGGGPAGPGVQRGHVAEPEGLKVCFAKK